MKQKLTELKRETNLQFVNRDVNTPFAIIARTLHRRLVKI